MRQLLLFFRETSYVFLFIFLEIIALFFLFSRNDYQKAKFLNSTSVIQRSINQEQKKFQDFINLKETNQLLAEENTSLYNEIQQLKTKLPIEVDSLIIDSITNENFTFQTAKVVSNFNNLSNTYLTINKGRNHGVDERAGIMLNNSIIGRVVLVEANYSLVMPIFHLNSKVNSKHLPSEYTGNLEWNGKTFDTVQLNKIPRNAEVEVGDTIVTNQYSKTFPEHTLIGTVEEIDLDYSKNFYQLEIKPFIEFSKLNYVYITQRKNLEEILEIETPE